MRLLLALALAQPPALWKLPSASPAALGPTMTWLEKFPVGRERTVAASRLMLGAPYELDPLGEGQRGSEHPRIRFDTVDCLTFVEASIALGQAAGAADVLPTLDSVRYTGAPSYADRNHFMMSEWVPSNVGKGYLKDLTRELEPAAGAADEEVTAETWAHRKGSRHIDLPQDHVPIGRWSLPIVTADQLLHLIPRIPEGTLLLVLRVPQPDRVDRVTHLGLVVHCGGKTCLRHASTLYEQVVDEPLDHFVARNTRYQHPPVAGFSLLQIEVPAKK
jgi:hypothetical protein